MNSPDISVIVPVFNRMEFLQQTLDSVRSQTFKDWELLAIDDGSNDETVEMLLKISQEEPRIKYRKHQPQRSGAPACRNEGTEISQAKYIIYLDSDDCLSPEALENRFREMEQHPDLDFGLFPCVIFRHQPGDMQFLWNADTGADDIDRFLAFDPPWQTMCPIWRRTSLEKLGLWKEDLPSWQDWEFHLRALIKNLKYRRFSSPDCFWRVPQQESIGIKSKSPEHLKSNEQLFAYMYTLIANEGLLTQERQFLLAALYLWLAQTWIAQRNMMEALRIWKLCCEKGLVAEPYYWQGIQYLKIMDFWYQKISESALSEEFAIKRIFPLTKKCFEIFWPEKLMPKWSKTFRKAPLPESYKLPV